MNAIETKKLTKYYGKSRGIIDLDLCVEEGEFFGFIGPNGAGKSTTIRALLGLITPTSGSARLLGKSCGRGNGEALTGVGFMPSETMFYSGMRVRDILRLSANLRGQNCDAEAKRLCDRLSLDTARKVDELSLGNRKKVGIVCALQSNPRLLLLDEPTSGLDPLIQREFFALLEECHAGGATIFLSSHVLSEIQRHCNRAAIIREGRMIACDQVSALSKTSAKRVTVRGGVALDSLEGIRGRQQTGDGMTFLYSGDIRELMQVLAASPITDVTIAEPDLEEIFLHYYTKENEREVGEDDDHIQA